MFFILKCTNIANEKMEDIYLLFNYFRKKEFVFCGF